MRQYSIKSVFCFISALPSSNVSSRMFPNTSFSQELSLYLVPGKVLYLGVVNVGLIPPPQTVPSILVKWSVSKQKSKV